MNCDCKNTEPGTSYSVLDRENGTIEGFTSCPCGKEVKSIYKQPYRPEMKEGDWTEKYEDPRA